MEEQAEQPPRRDIWEKIGLILHSSGGLLTAVTVALIGFIGSSYLKDREIRESEERSFLRPGPSSMDERVLNLELLAYNFHESLNLKPLFLYLEKQIVDSNDRSRKKEYLDRLYRVAAEISRKQLLVLEGAGRKYDRDIVFDDLKKNPGGLRLEDATLTLNDITRQFSLVVLSVDPQTRQIQVRLEIKTPKANGDPETSTAEFWVGYFDFPMIDNTRLPQDQRAAVVLNTLEDGYANVTLAYFPGSYASLKEKASYQEVFQNLMRSNKTLSQ